MERLLIKSRLVRLIEDQYVVHFTGAPQIDPINHPVSVPVHDDDRRRIPLGPGIPIRIHRGPATEHQVIPDREAAKPWLELPTGATRVAADLATI